MCHHSQLVGLRTQAKNSLPARIALYNLSAPVTDLFGEHGREILAQEIIPQLRPAPRKVLGNHLRFMDHLEAQMTAPEGAIELTPEQPQAVQLLTTMAGVGKTIAHTRVAEIGAIPRLQFLKALCHWAGLTACSAAFSNRCP